MAHFLSFTHASVLSLQSWHTNMPKVISTWLFHQEWAESHAFASPTNLICLSQEHSTSQDNAYRQEETFELSPLSGVDHLHIPNRNVVSTKTVIEIILYQSSLPSSATPKHFTILHRSVDTAEHENIWLKSAPLSKTVQIIRTKLQTPVHHYYLTQCTGVSLINKVIWSDFFWKYSLPKPES